MLHEHGILLHIYIVRWNNYTFPRYDLRDWEQFEKKREFRKHDRSLTATENTSRGTVSLVRRFGYFGRSLIHLSTLEKKIQPRGSRSRVKKSSLQLEQTAWQKGKKGERERERKERLRAEADAQKWGCSLIFLNKKPAGNMWLLLHFLRSFRPRSRRLHS